MIGNHLLEYRLMKEHQDRLLAEGQQLQLANAVRAGRRGRPLRTAAARLGSRLEAIGRRLQSLESRVPARP